MADLISSLSTAITLAKRLREISKNIEDAEFKNLLADLSLELADAKSTIADLINENTDLKEKINLLTSSAGETCPKCNQRTFQLISSKPHPELGDLGVKQREYKCSSCNFEESKIVES